MSKIYRAAVVGCSRMGAFIDNEFVGLPGRYAPHSHAAGYAAHDRTDLVAGVDMRPDVLAQFGQRYGVAESHLYTDYREMLAKEQPDILSVATQPEQRAEIAIYAAEHGVKALYCEKALCASLQEADAIVAAVERHGVVFNMGTNRRWHPGYAKMRDLIASGDLGKLELLLIYNNSALFNSSSHNFDLMQFLNGDEPVIWAQGGWTAAMRSSSATRCARTPMRRACSGLPTGSRSTSCAGRAVRTTRPSARTVSSPRATRTLTSWCGAGSAGDLRPLAHHS